VLAALLDSARQQLENFFTDLSHRTTDNNSWLKAAAVFFTRGIDMDSATPAPTYGMQQRSERADFYIRDKHARSAETGPHRHEYFRFRSISAVTPCSTLAA